MITGISVNVATLDGGISAINFSAIQHTPVPIGDARYLFRDELAWNTTHAPFEKDPGVEVSYHEMIDKIKSVIPEGLVDDDSAFINVYVTKECGNSVSTDIMFLAAEFSFNGVNCFCVNIA